MTARLCTIVKSAVANVRQWQLSYGIAVVFLVTASAVALTVQGWRSRIPTFDLVTYIHSVRDFVATGALPQYGDTGSYGSLSPPGTAWLMLPSTVLFRDPRLSEYAGAALLHFVALLGLFLLARKYFGTWCACLAVALYGLSSQGLFQAGSLWAIGSPDMFIWMVYLASEWVTRRDGKYLAGAALAWGIGMYVDMTITPALAILPTLWLIYRPPVRLKPLLIGAGLALLIWFPYLRFEAPRNFADIRSQLLFQQILPANYNETWCDPTHTLRNANETTNAGPLASNRLRASTTEAAVSATGESVLERAESTVRDRLLGNLTSGPIPGARIVLLLMLLSALLLLTVSGARPGSAESTVERDGWQRWLTPIAIGAIGCAVLAGFLDRLLDLSGELPSSVVSVGRTSVKLLLASGIALLAARWTSAGVDRWFARAGVRVQTADQRKARLLLVLSLGVPWFIVFVLAEPGKPERFQWLWPLQAMFLAVFATRVLPRLGAPRVVVWASQAFLLVALIGNSFLLSRVDAWREDGWSGREASEVQVVDYVAGQLDAQEKDRTAIGYKVFIYPFMANYNITNPRYKVGADFDMLFRYRHGITNTDTCAEGFSSKDEYRILRTQPESGEGTPRDYFDVPLRPGFRLVREFGPYQVFKRVKSL